MDDDSWVKLYRKSLSNDIRRHDPTAWRLFETLLLLVDSRTGRWSGGIYQLTEADGYLKSNTIYKALNRLVENGMITKKSNTRYSEIHICKFAEYHKTGKTSSKNEVKTGYKPSKTLTRSKNKEVRNIKEINKEKNDAFESLNSFWSELSGRRMSDNKTARTSLKKLLAAGHSEEDIQYAIKGAVYFQGKQYKPQVMSFAALYEKWDNLIGHMQATLKKGAENESNRFE